MKNKLGTVFFYIFLAAIALYAIASLIDLGYNVFEFFENAVDKLGGGFWGVMLLALVIIGVFSMIRGLGHPPKFIDKICENAPEIVGKIIVTVYLLLVGLAILAFSELGQY